MFLWRTNFMNKNNILEKFAIVFATVISIVTIAACALQGCSSTQFKMANDAKPQISNDLSYFPNAEQKVTSPNIAYTLQITLFDEQGEGTQVLLYKDRKFRTK